MKKILILQDIPVDSIEKLRKYFQPDKIYEYYCDGSLYSWLQCHNYFEESQRLTFVDHTIDITMKKILLSLILGADFNKLNSINQELLTEFLSKINTIKNSLGCTFQLSDVTHLYVKTVSISSDSASLFCSGSGQAGGYGLHII